MLTLTRKTEYALIALSHLAAEPDRLSSAREIADTYRIPLPVLTNILKTLNRTGLVDSERGAKGGYRLAKDPCEIKLSMLIHAIEGPVNLVNCSGPGGDKRKSCNLMDWCPVRAPVLKVHRRLQQFLEEVSLEEIVAEQAASASAESPCQ